MKQKHYFPILTVIVDTHCQTSCRFKSFRQFRQKRSLIDQIKYGLVHWGIQDLKYGLGGTTKKNHQPFSLCFVASLRGCRSLYGLCASIFIYSRGGVTYFSGDPTMLGPLIAEFRNTVNSACKGTQGTFKIISL